MRTADMLWMFKYWTTNSLSARQMAGVRGKELV
jgi:hypothetical protein